MSSNATSSSTTNPTPGASSEGLLRTGFQAEVDASDGEVVVRLHGDLDMATASELRQTLTTILGTAPVRLTIDLSALEFVDSTGIGVLVGGFRRARDEGCDFSLRFPNRPVKKVLHLTGIDQMVPIEPSSN